MRRVTDRGTLCSFYIEWWILDVCLCVGYSVAHAPVSVSVSVSCALVCTNVGLATTYMRSLAPRSCFTILKCLLYGRVLEPPGHRTSVVVVDRLRYIYRGKDVLVQAFEKGD